MRHMRIPLIACGDVDAAPVLLALTGGALVAAADVLTADDATHSSPGTL